MRTFLLLLFLVPLPAMAAYEGFAAVADDELAGMRGGFTARLGNADFEIAFGIQRAVSLNGAPLGFRNIVQNGLDGQLIRQVTVIDARVRALEAFSAGRFSDALNARLLQSIR